MATEAEFLANPLVCQNCKDYWLKYRAPKAPWVCVDCADLRHADNAKNK